MKDYGRQANADIEYDNKKNPKKIEIDFGIRKSIMIKGHQAWFEIDNQTFYLEPWEENKEEPSEEIAQWFCDALKLAFKKIR